MTTSSVDAGRSTTALRHAVARSAREGPTGTKGFVPPCRSAGRICSCQHFRRCGAIDTIVSYIPRRRVYTCA